MSAADFLDNLCFYTTYEGEGSWRALQSDNMMVYVGRTLNRENLEESLGSRVHSVKTRKGYVYDFKLAAWTSLPSAPLVTESVGTKFDSEKPRMDLLDPHFLEGVASVLSFGAQKYAAHNWRQGIPISRLIAAAYRHLGAFNSGEDLDPESGLPHLHHLGCCVMFLSWMHETKPTQDDRFISNPKLYHNDANAKEK